MHQLLYVLAFLAMVVCPAVYAVTNEPRDEQSR
jgi:hypothetical protein